MGRTIRTETGETGVSSSECGGAVCGRGRCCAGWVGGEAGGEEGEMAGSDGEEVEDEEDEE